MFRHFSFHSSVFPKVIRSFSRLSLVFRKMWSYSTPQPLTRRMKMSRALTNVDCRAWRHLAKWIGRLAIHKPLLFAKLHNYKREDYTGNIAWEEKLTRRLDINGKGWRGFVKNVLHAVNGSRFFISSDDAKGLELRGLLTETTLVKSTFQKKGSFFSKLYGLRKMQQTHEGPSLQHPLPSRVSSAFCCRMNLRENMMKFLQFFVTL